MTALLSGRPEEARQHATGLTVRDWPAFRDLVIERHRVAPLVGAALAEAGFAVPDEIVSDIRSAARQCGAAALAQREESLRINAQLAAMSIFAIWLKGWPLAEWLYDGIGLRHASDLDLLVAPADRAAAARCLVEAGYHAEAGHGLRARLIAHPAVGAECKDLEFRHSGTGLRVELHWRTNHFRSWPSILALEETPVSVTEGPTPIRVPGPLGQLVYLSAHGQQHMFGRLKWLVDIARLVEKRGVEAVSRDLRRACDLGAGRPVRLALHLAGAVFGVSVPREAAELSPREAEWTGEIAGAIADPRLAPGAFRTRVAFYHWHWRMADGPAQRLGVLRDAVWRRLRLRAAGFAGPGWS